jgi:predicted transposase YbfD/YdcC
MSPQRAPLIRHFSELKDPRRNRHNKKKHKLLDVIVIAICSALCGIDEFKYMEIWAKERHEWLKKFLELPYGVPSHDTMNRIFAKTNPKAFHDCFVAWIAEVATLANGEIVAIDGKTLRRSFDKAKSKTALHIVSAWAAGNRLVLGQVAVEDKSNEITAIPKLLKALELSGCLITIDAMGTQREIAAKIIEAEADYTLALKGNQKSLHEDVVAAFEQVDLKQVDKRSHAATAESRHGRVDVRHYFIINDVTDIQATHQWPGLVSIGLVRSLRVTDEGSSVESRYYLNSYKANVKKFAAAVRGHWGVESMHWQLDVSLFNEDKSRARTESAPENLAVLRHIALNLHKRNPEKGSMPSKKLLCMLNPERLLKTLLS